MEVDSTYNQPWFIGATDSSFPCALMIQMAEMLDKTLEVYEELIERRQNINN